jgi:uncharacterized lipoprotein YmbA
VKVFLRRQKHLAIMIFGLALAGCLGGPSGQTNFYMLSPMSPSQAGTSAATAEGRIHIGLETVVMAEYLNRNEIVLNLDNTIYDRPQFGQYDLSTRRV